MRRRQRPRPAGLRRHGQHHQLCGRRVVLPREVSASASNPTSQEAFQSHLTLVAFSQGCVDDHFGISGGANNMFASTRGNIGFTRYGGAIVAAGRRETSTSVSECRALCAPGGATVTGWMAGQAPPPATDYFMIDNGACYCIPEPTACMYTDPNGRGGCGAQGNTAADPVNIGYVNGSPRGWRMVRLQSSLSCNVLQV